MAKALMIQGTGSGVGKSVLVAGLCRVVRDIGIKVAPFKAQNMALNSFITKEGGEIGRAQAFQAEAAGIEPCNDINPILLKATSESGCQVIVNGRVHANMNAVDYYAFKDEAWQAVTSAYDRLSEKYDVIVIEGAGSPAEINLRNEEIVNMKVARYTNAPVILVGDIDKGGVFASFHGTIGLLDGDAEYIKAFIVNKFRGDIDILRPGLRMIEEKTGRPVIGVINYFGDLGLHEEDAIPVERLKPEHADDNGQLKIVVLGLRYISNFTDFDPFMYEPGIELKYSLRKEDISSADLIIVPGSKNTVDDLLFLRKHGIDKYVIEAVKKGVSLIGICGGYQMLGQRIFDPHNVESSLKEVDGMGFLDISTTLDRTKTTCQVEAQIADSSWLMANSKKKRSSNYELSTMSQQLLKGYEIHMGSTTGDVGLFKLRRLQSTLHHAKQTGRQEQTGGQAEHPPNNRRAGRAQTTDKNNLGSEFWALSSEVPDGSLKGTVWGTYIHGLFDNDGFRKELLDSLRQKKGMPSAGETVNYSERRNSAIDRWADILRNSTDICFILKQLGMEYCKEDLMNNRD
ncbi:MAG TPA: cobyric acid synthase [Nitrospirae bacterium]|nr:cobyric acid synthase [Nitrospirota bacterium]